MVAHLVWANEGANLQCHSTGARLTVAYTRDTGSIPGLGGYTLCLLCSFTVICLFFCPRCKRMFDAGWLATATLGAPRTNAASLGSRQLHPHDAHDYSKLLHLLIIC